MPISVVQTGVGAYANGQAIKPVSRVFDLLERHQSTIENLLTLISFGNILKEPPQVVSFPEQGIALTISSGYRKF